MKKIKVIIAAFFIMCASAMNAQPMNYNAMCNNARFLTDRMAYTLGITTAAIIDDIYRINYDYICGVNDYLDDVALGYHNDEYMAICYERDRALQYLLGDILWARLIGYDYFYRPIVFANRGWRFSIYTHDTRFNHYYCHTPRYFREYRGGHFFHGMASRGITPIGNRMRYNGGANRGNLNHRDVNERGHRDSYNNVRNDNNRSEFNANRGTFNTRNSSVDNNRGTVDNSNRGNLSGNHEGGRRETGESSVSRGSNTDITINRSEAAPKNFRNDAGTSRSERSEMNNRSETNRRSSSRSSFSGNSNESSSRQYSRGSGSSFSRSGGESRGHSTNSSNGGGKSQRSGSGHGGGRR